MSGHPGRMVTVHACEDSCPAAVTGATFLHGSLFKEVRLEDQAWFSNLKGEREAPEGPDELAALRRAAEMGAGVADPPAAKEKKKKEKKRKKDRDSDDKKEDKNPLEPGQKSLRAVFAGTGLDPDPQFRSKILRKARKVGEGKKKKKRKKKSETEDGSEGSGETSSSSSSMVLGEGLFETEKKIKVIWKKYPGALSASAVSEARENLVTSAGTLWEVNRQQIPPLMTQYGRTSILPGMAPALSQEVLTLCVAVDQLLQGRVAACSDLLCQRIKSLEAIGKGNHWQVARQLELVRAEAQGITNDDEALQAARRAREEAKLRSLTSKPPNSNPSEPSYGGGGHGKGKKGKDAKGQGKGRSDDQPRGRGDNRKDDRGGWQKKDQNQKS